MRGRLAQQSNRCKYFHQKNNMLSLLAFSDQSQFSRHFKRLIGVTPGQFRTPARIA